VTARLPHPPEGEPRSAILGRDVRVEGCPGGPLLVRGADTIIAPDGRTFPVERPVVALCRCDRSRRHPWCDGTHKVAGPRR